MQLDNLRGITMENQDLKKEVKRLAQTNEQKEAEHVELSERCRTLVQSCEFEWHDDHRKNLRSLQEVRGPSRRGGVGTPDGWGKYW